MRGQIEKSRLTINSGAYARRGEPLPLLWQGYADRLRQQKPRKR